jgi:hypothetical protein
MKSCSRVIGAAVFLLIADALLIIEIRSRPTTAATETEPLFVDVAEAGGVNAVLRSTVSKNYLPETVGGGVCLLDYDNDGVLDIYLVNGSSLERFQSHAPGYGNHLYRNRGDGTFEDVTHKAGVAGKEWGMGCVAGDYNNDGFTDLYVTNFGRNQLYRNNGNGTFTEVGHISGTDHVGWSTSAVWGDFDRDGWLDLYVSNYVDYDFAHPPAPGTGDNCTFLGLPVACGPGGLKPAYGVFYRNRGDGTFVEESALRGLHPTPYFSLGACAADYDGDGNLDLFVANDSTPNFLFHNQGNGTFQEQALQAGVAFNQDGNPQAGMGVDFADYDNDGRPDIIVTTFAKDTNTVYHNEGKGQFSDATARTAQREGYPYVKWGAGFVDLDNDGLKDIYVVTGHIYPQVDSLHAAAGYRSPDQFFRNLGGGRFINASARLTHPPHVGRGAAFGDLNNDGRVDIVVSNFNDRPNVLINHDQSRNHWILIRCIGTSSNRQAIAARVSVTTEAGTQVAEVRTGCSFLSSSDPRVHFGLGQSSQIRELAVRWPSGRISVFKDVAADQILTLTEPAAKLSK